LGSLEEARRKIEERRSQQATQGSGTDFWLRKDDLAIVHFICTGGEGDPYFDTYVAHEYPASGQGKYSTLKYCPVESGHDENYPCEGCREGIKTKDRMIMWFHVYNILHANLKGTESFPQVSWSNKVYFNREVNAPKVWDTSAWRESAIDDILMLGAQLGSLHKTRINLVCSGEGLSKRFKLYMEPGSEPFDPETYEADKQLIRPVVEVLRDQLVTVPTVQNPQAMSQAAVPGPGGASIPPFVPSGGTSSVPALNIGKAKGPVAVGEPVAPTPISTAASKGKKKDLF